MNTNSFMSIKFLSVLKCMLEGYLFNKKLSHEKGGVKLVHVAVKIIICYDNGCRLYLWMI